MPKHSYEKYLHKKSYTRCALLLIPGFGNLAVWIYDLIEANKVKEAFRRVEGGQQPLADLDIKTQKRFIKSSDLRLHSHLKNASEEVQHHFIARNPRNVIYTKAELRKAFVEREALQLQYSDTRSFSFIGSHFKSGRRNSKKSCWRKLSFVFSIKKRTSSGFASQFGRRSSRRDFIISLTQVLAKMFREVLWAKILLPFSIRPGGSTNITSDFEE